MDTQFLKIPEVAKLCRVDNRTVRRWIKEGKMEAIQVVPGSQYLINITEIPAFYRKEAK